jgi:hypothetical protein
MSEVERADDFESFIERLVDAHARGAAEEVARLLERVNDFADDLTMGEEEDAGVLLPWDILRAPGQKRKWSRKAVAKVIEEQPDADVYPGWRVGVFSDALGREAFFAWLIYGYSFTGISIEPVGVFDSQEEALDAVRRVGIIELADYSGSVKERRRAHSAK